MNLCEERLPARCRGCSDWAAWEPFASELGCVCEHGSCPKCGTPCPSAVLQLERICERCENEHWTHHEALATPAAVKTLLASMTDDEFWALYRRLTQGGTSLREYVGALAAREGRWSHVELVATGGGR